METYSAAFAAKLASELEALPTPDCNRIEVSDDCSALATFTLDGIRLRDQIKAVK